MSELLECPHCGSVAEYVSEHAKGKRWAVACTMTSKVAAGEGRPMCRCRTPFFRDKGQARDVWNRRTAVTDYDFAMAVHDGRLWVRVVKPTWSESDKYRCECGEQLRGFRHRCPTCGGWVDYDGVGPKAVLDR